MIFPPDELNRREEEIRLKHNILIEHAQGLDRTSSQVPSMVPSNRGIESRAADQRERSNPSREPTTLNQTIESTISTFQTPSAELNVESLPPTVLSHKADFSQ